MQPLDVDRRGPLLQALDLGTEAVDLCLALIGEAEDVGLLRDTALEVLDCLCDEWHQLPPRVGEVVRVVIEQVEPAIINLVLLHGLRRLHDGLLARFRHARVTVVLGIEAVSRRVRDVLTEAERQFLEGNLLGHRDGDPPGELVGAAQPVEHEASTVHVRGAPGGDHAEVRGEPDDLVRERVGHKLEGFVGVEHPALVLHLGGHHSEEPTGVQHVHVCVPLQGVHHAFTDSADDGVHRIEFRAGSDDGCHMNLLCEKTPMSTPKGPTGVLVVAAQRETPEGSPQD
ncbi:hypothetical protein 10RS306A_gene4605 [Ralstonia phage 10RS306A]|uniref:Uncharacterized protein n=1 Tax=Ralstonia phage 10RS306A TaxID=2968818 RepID=A0A977XRM0_9CAUD|nr:hypothetical protein 10RS306A_gene4605 [Ralstonia phage 10RS306A]